MKPAGTHGRIITEYLDHLTAEKGLADHGPTLVPCSARQRQLYSTSLSSVAVGFQDVALAPRNESTTWPPRISS